MDGFNGMDAFLHRIVYRAFGTRFVYASILQFYETLAYTFFS